MNKEITLNIHISSYGEEDRAEAEKVASKIWEAVHGVGQMLQHLTQGLDVEQWPDESLAAAAACLLNADAARRSLLAGKIPQALVENHVGEWQWLKLPSKDQMHVLSKLRPNPLPEPPSEPLPTDKELMKHGYNLDLD